MSEIAGYRLLRQLGEGGMGSVHLAEAPDGQRVAIKLVRPQLLERDEFRKRFRQEVARAQKVPPFCTAEVLAADPDHEPPYLVIEYVDGPNLHQVVMDSGPLRGAALHSLAVGVATALTAIHGAGVIHRDLKPGNVLLPRGGIKVIDFGIARGVEADAEQLTTDNQVIGTIPYTSPERLGGARTLTPAADLFAWGAVMTFAATGHTPFYGDTPADTAVSILSDEPDLEGLSGRLRDLVELALAKDPGARPSARQLLDMLLTTSPSSRAAAEAAPATSPDTGSTMSAALPPVTAGRSGRRKAALAVACAVALIAIYAIVDTRWRTWLPAAGSVQAGPSNSPVASLSPIASPIPSPSAPVSASPTAAEKDFIPAGLRLVLRTDLSTPGDWRPSDDRDRGRCALGVDGLTPTLPPGSAIYKCAGRFDQTTDFAAYVDVKTSGRSCAAIWFRFQANGSDGPGVQQPDGGYALQICGTRAYFVTHNTAYRTLREMALPTSSAAGMTRIGIIARGHEFTFYQDGNTLATVDDDTFRIGRIALGLFQRNDDPLTGYTATFSDLLLYGTALSGG